MKLRSFGALTLLALAGLALTLAGSAGADPPSYTTIDLGATTSPYSYADINERGQAVGGYGEAILWARGVTTDLGDLGGGITEARGINDLGQVVGYSWRTGFAGVSAFLWQGGVMTNLDPESAGSSANDINNRGQVVGSRSTASGALHATLWENGVMSDLGTLGGPNSEAMGINDRGQIVGWSDTTTDYPSPVHAFMWEKGAMTDLGPGTSYSTAVDINERGQVVGVTESSHAFLWEKGVMTDLGMLGGTYPYSVPYAINDLGQVVGRASTDHGDEHAFLWKNGVMTDLGAHNSGAQGINNHGDIVGYYVQGYSMSVALWQRTP